MIRVKISNFIKQYKNKISDFGKKLIIVAIVVFIATIMLSLNRSQPTNPNTVIGEIYTPKETIISGENVTEEQYNIDNQTIQNFIQYCNDQNVEEAYRFLSDGCKKNLYTTIDVFKENYYTPIFAEKREYHLQSWISTEEYTVYKIRYTTNLLATGKYDKSNVYQDYITLVKNEAIPKISIGKLITSQEIKTEPTQVEELSARVIQKIVYIDEEIYELEVKNKTENTIVLDTLERTDGIQLIDTDGGTYRTNVNKVFESELTIKPQQTRTMTLHFNKLCSSEKKADYIQFYRVIRNQESEEQDTVNNTNMFSFKVKI